MEGWERSAIAAAAILCALLLARLVDWRIARRELRPEVVTRYRVLRRTVTVGIIAVGVLSALLVVPQVRAIAGGLLASSAVLGLVVGFAARSTLANAVAGLLIAFTQPLRIDDDVTVGGTRGTVEEIGLAYTFIRSADGARLVIPNEKLASDTILNSTIVSREKLAEVTVQIPLANDLGAMVDLLGRELAGEPGAEVAVTALAAGEATVALRVRATDPEARDRLQSELRIRAQRALREAGMYA